MDIALIAVGAGLAIWGSRLKDEVGTRTHAGLALLGIGTTVLAVGVIIFAVAFAIGFNQGLQSS